jgi:hypothetical protein
MGQPTKKMRKASPRLTSRNACSAREPTKAIAIKTTPVLFMMANVRNQRRAAVMSAEGTALPARPLWIEGLAHGSYLATFLRSKRVIKVTSLVE